MTNKHTKQGSSLYRIANSALLPCLLLCLSRCLPYAQTFPQPIDSGRIFLYNEEYTKAADYYEQAIKRNPNSLHAHRYYQNACIANGDSAKRAVCLYYELLLKANLQSPLYHYLYGRCLDCAKGIKYFDKALKLSFCYAWAMNAKGACYFEGKDHGSAKEEFLKAIKCDGHFYEAYQNLAQVYLETNNERKAKKVFRKLIAKNRQNPKSYEWLGDMYLEQEKYKYAGSAYLKSIDLGGREPGMFFKQGYACFKKQRYGDAVKNYQKSIQAGNRNFNVHYNLASSLELLNYPEEALEHYQKAYHKREDYKILYSIGNCAVMLGLYSKAIESYQDFLKEEPKNTEALFGLANAYQLKKDYQRAIEIHEKILSLDRAFSKAYYNLGSIYAYHIKNRNKMKFYWGKFVKQFPKHEDADFIRKEMKKMEGP